MDKLKLLRLREDMEAILKRIIIVDAELNTIQQIASVYIMKVDELLEQEKEEEEGGEHNVH